MKKLTQEDANNLKDRMFPQNNIDQKIDEYWNEQGMYFERDKFENFIKSLLSEPKKGESFRRGYMQGCKDTEVEMERKINTVEFDSHGTTELWCKRRDILKIIKER